MVCNYWPVILKYRNDDSALEHHSKHSLASALYRYHCPVTDWVTPTEFFLAKCVLSGSGFISVQTLSELRAVTFLKTADAFLLYFHHPVSCFIRVRKSSKYFIIFGRKCKENLPFSSPIYFMKKKKNRIHFWGHKLCAGLSPSFTFYVRSSSLLLLCYPLTSYY